MNKKVIIGIIVLIVILIIAVIAIKFSRLDKNTIELTVVSNAGIPYEWKYEIEDDSIVKYEKDYIIEDKNKGGLVGAEVYRNFVFKGLKQGVTKVTLKLVSITDESIAKQEEFNLKVDDNNAIALVVETI